jgi:glycosyltransferase involved in cell wall biosynthesis
MKDNYLLAKPVLSVVIPCYNQGMYLKDALDSLEPLDRSLIEIIIVNDGSTDVYTNEYIQRLAGQGYNVILQPNQGLGAARNNGIKASAGKYILPLDADNKIYPAYITKGIVVMENDEEIAVVYGNPEFFGAKSGVHPPGPFNLQQIMLGNYIDACAIVRKSVVEKVGFYENMKIMGYEDWDLWLRIALKGYKFHYINETLFFYRVHPQSMMKTLNRDIRRQNEIEDYLAEKYKDQLSFPILKNYFIGRIKRHPFLFFYRLVLQKYFPAYYERLIREGKIYKGWLYE